MAVTVTTHLNGARNLVVELQIALANTDAVVVDVSALGITERLELREAQWSLTGAGATLEWDQTTDAGLLECSSGSGFYIAPEGVSNPAGSGSTGDVLLTNAAGLTSGTIYLKFIKR